MDSLKQPADAPNYAGISEPRAAAGAQRTYRHRLRVCAIGPIPDERSIASARRQIQKKLKEKQATQENMSMS